ncbi:MAG: transcriptional repressor LexA [Endomicrobiales bacterium]|nr:transcriptional repressor LexA [Endomicrobiales bacterium]
MENLTEKQKKMLDFIKHFASSSGVAPTIREIAKKFDLSIGGVQRHLKALIKKGYLKHNRGISRGIDLPFRKHLVPVPVLGRVQAGMPVPAVEDAEDSIYVDVNIARGGSYFALRVQGDSMTGSGIFDNDLVIVRQQNMADHGDIVVAMVDGESTVKQLHKQKGEVYLNPTNPKYPPIYARDIQVLGKVVYLNRKF